MDDDLPQQPDDPDPDPHQRTLTSYASGLRTLLRRAAASGVPPGFCDCRPAPIPRQVDAPGEPRVPAGIPKPGSMPVGWGSRPNHWADNGRSAFPAIQKAASPQ